MRLYPFLGMVMIFLVACASGNKTNMADTVATPAAVETIPTIPLPAFDADSAYSFVEQLMSFGPRVPNEPAHVKSGNWLVKKLKEFGFQVSEQNAVLETFDGTKLKARNIFAQINPEDSIRILLTAHWDCRPWADQDPDPEKRQLPVPGANDGASGIGVLLEIARQMSLRDSVPGLDILFVDAEDWGTDDNEDSWALGTKYFGNNLPYEGYSPKQSILLDMVGSPDAKFGFEYFSQQANSELLELLWNNAAALGHGKYFHKGFGGAITDDHYQLTQHGIPTIDIIDYRTSSDYSGFDPVWHTTHDDMKNISRQTLGAVGETVMSVLVN